MPRSIVIPVENRRLHGSSGRDDGAHWQAEIERVVVLHICQPGVHTFPQNDGVVGFFMRYVVVRHVFRQQIACMVVQLRLV